MVFFHRYNLLFENRFRYYMSFCRPLHDMFGQAVLAKQFSRRSLCIPGYSASLFSMRGSGISHIASTST